MGAFSSGIDDFIGYYRAGESIAQATERAPKTAGLRFLPRYLLSASPTFYFNVKGWIASGAFTSSRPVPHDRLLHVPTLTDLPKKNETMK